VIRPRSEPPIYPPVYFPPTVGMSSHRTLPPLSLRPIPFQLPRSHLPAASRLLPVFALVPDSNGTPNRSHRSLALSMWPSRVSHADNYWSSFRPPTPIDDYP